MPEHRGHQKTNGYHNSMFKLSTKNITRRTKHEI